MPRDQPSTPVAVMAAAVIATLAPMVVLAVALIVATLWSMARTGGSASMRTLEDAGAFIGMAGAITMVAVYAVGLPVALAIERGASGRTALRWLLYGAAGSAAGTVVAVWLANDNSGALLTSTLLFGGFGLLTALAGGAAVGWFRRRSAATARRIGRGGSIALIVIAATGWLATGGLFIPLVAAAATGGAALLLLELLHRSQPS